MKITDKHKRFVKEYLIDGNASRAALAAGYKGTGVGVTAHRLLKEPEIMQLVEKGNDNISKKLDLTREKVLEELSKLGFSNMQDYMRTNEDGDPVLDFSKLTREQAAALTEVTVDSYIEGGAEGREVKKVKFKLADKRAALVDLGKHLGMFKEEEGGNKVDIKNLSLQVIQVLQGAAKEKVVDAEYKKIEA